MSAFNSDTFIKGELDKLIKKIHKINSKINTLPPLLPAIYGNFQIAPKPTALPAAANIKPILVEN